MNEYKWMNETIKYQPKIIPEGNLSELYLWL